MDKNAQERTRMYETRLRNKYRGKCQFLPSSRKMWFFKRKLGKTSLKIPITYVLDIGERDSDEKNRFWKKKNFADFLAHPTVQGWTHISAPRTKFKNPLGAP